MTDPSNKISCILNMKPIYFCPCQLYIIVPLRATNIRVSVCLLFSAKALISFMPKFNDNFFFLTFQNCGIGLISSQTLFLFLSSSGKEFVSRKWGYFCTLCSVPFLNEGTKEDQHCQTQMHYNNLQVHTEAVQMDPWLHLWGSCLCFFFSHFSEILPDDYEAEIFKNI